MGKRALEYLEQQKGNGQTIPTFSPSIDKNHESSSESEQEEKPSPVLTPSSTSERASPDSSFGSFKLPPAQVLPVNLIEAPNSVTIKIDEPHAQLNLPVNYYTNNAISVSSFQSVYYQKNLTFSHSLSVFLFHFYTVALTLCALRSTHFHLVPLI